TRQVNMTTKRKLHDSQNRDHVDELLKMLDDDDENDISEDFGDESDTDGKNQIESLQDNSETEQEDESNNSNEEMELNKEKDKITKWVYNPKSKRVRVQTQNLIKRLTGVINEILHANTNQYIEDTKDKYDRERDAKPIDLVDLKMFIGLLFLAGVYQCNRLSLKELWDSIERLSLVMSIKRLKFIIRCLRFDDRFTREERRKRNQLAVVPDCQKNYSLGENVTLDEKLEAFHERCSFRLTIPGKQPNGPFNVSNKPVDVVKRLAHFSDGSGRNLTADNWFTDIELVEYLRQKKISYVGTVKKKKRQLPQTFILLVGRSVDSSTFGFDDSTTVVSYVLKKGIKERLEFHWLKRFKPVTQKEKPEGSQEEEEPSQKKNKIQEDSDEPGPSTRGLAPSPEAIRPFPKAPKKKEDYQKELEEVRQKEVKKKSVSQKIMLKSSSESSESKQPVTQDTDESAEFLREILNKKESNDIIENIKNVIQRDDSVLVLIRKINLRMSLKTRTAE
ncbi:hypothetical protein ILUMI_17646, partial [Ignelater luminosus]